MIFNCMATLEVTEVPLLTDATKDIKEVAENPGIIRTYLEGLVPDILNFALQVVIALLIYFIGARLIKFFVKMVRKGMQKAGTEVGVREFLCVMLKYALYVILAIVILNLFGIATTSAVAVLGSAGVALGLALQGSLSNLAGGVLILLLRPFRIGDYIIEDNHKNEGTVSEISIFYTKLVTIDNRVIVIPNGTLANSSLTNVSHMEKRRIDLIVGISYESDLKKAKELLYELAKQEEKRIPEDEITVYVDSLGDSSVNLGIRVWVKTEDYWPVRWKMLEEIKYSLEEHGISIPYQQIDVQIKQ